MGSTATAPSHGRALWDAMLDADMNVEMWRLSSKFFARLKIFSRVIATILGTSSVAALVGPFSAAHPKAWAIALAIGTAIGVISEFALPNSAALEHMHELSSNWKKLCIEFELLYAHDEELATMENWNQFKKLQGRTVNVHKKEGELPYLYLLHWWATRRVLRKRGLKYE